MLLSFVGEWIVYESGVSMDVSVALDGKSANRLLEVSPCQYVDQMTTPILFLLGAKDARVPMQGVSFLEKLYKFLI